MTAIEIVLPDGSPQKIVSGSIYEHAVPVVQRDGPPRMIRWGGFIQHSCVKTQLHARPALIEVICWSMGSLRYGWQFTKPDEFLQGCMIRTFDDDQLVVYGVIFGRKPRILQIPGKQRRQNLLQLPN